MNYRLEPSEIPLISGPITSSNRRNANHQPVTNLGCCTPSELFGRISLTRQGTVCILGKAARGIGVAKALIRRSGKPFLLLGTAADKDSAFSALKPDWKLNTVRQTLPSGSGALYLSQPSSSYLEFCQYLEAWSQTHFLILHLGTGLQVGNDLFNVLPSLGQCLIFCDSLSTSLRRSESGTVPPLEFMKQIRYLLCFSAGGAPKELIELLPTYQYERITNTMSFNGFRSFRHWQPGLSVSQTRTLQDKKNVFEQDDLNAIFKGGKVIVYHSDADALYLAELT